MKKEEREKERERRGLNVLLVSYVVQVFRKIRNSQKRVEKNLSFINIRLAAKKKRKIDARVEKSRVEQREGASWEYTKGGKTRSDAPGLFAREWLTTVSTHTDSNNRGED